MRKGHKIAILLRHPGQLSDACSYGRALIEIGAVVSYYCLCCVTAPEMNWNIKPLLAIQAPCYTNNLEIARRHKLECLSIGAIVQGIESADWVIPI